MNIMSFFIRVCVLAALSVSGVLCGENRERDVVVVEAVGIGSSFDKGVEAACRNAIRQATVVSVEESRRTSDESITRDEDFSYTETTSSEILTSSEGQIVGYEVLEAKPADGGMEVRIRASVRTPEALKRNFESVMREGIRLCRARNYAASIASFEQARKIPGYTENEYAVRWLAYARTAMQNQTRYVALMNNAVGLYNAQQYDDAERVFRQVFQLKGYGNDRQAKQWLEKTQAAKVDMRHGKMSLEAGIDFYREGRFQEAATEFSRIPDDPEARRWLDRTEDELHKIERRKKQYNTTIAKIQAFIKKGDSVFFGNKAAHYSEAELEIASALSAYPNDPALLELRQRVKDKLAEAEQQSKQAKQTAGNIFNALVGGALRR